MDMSGAGGGQPGNGRRAAVCSNAAAGAAQARLVDVLGLVAANAAAALAPPERKVLRLVCRDVCEAHDAAVLPGGLTIRADRVPEGAAGEQQLARFFGRPGCAPPASLTIRSSQDEPLAAQQLLTIMQAAAPNATSLVLDGRMPNSASSACATAIAHAAPRMERLCIRHFIIQLGCQQVPSCITASLLHGAAGRLVSLQAETSRFARWGVDEFTALAACSRLAELRVGVYNVGRGATAPLDVIAGLPLLRSLTLYGVRAAGTTLPAEVAALAQLSALVHLRQLRIAGVFLDPQQRVELCRIVGGWPALRELDLGELSLDGTALAALATSPITSLHYGIEGPPPAACALAPPLPPQQGVLQLQQQAAGAVAATLAARGPVAGPLPPQLRELRLSGTPLAAALAALLPAPPSLELVELGMAYPLDTPGFGLQWVYGRQRHSDNTRLHPSTAAHVAGAMALLAGRMPQDWRAPHHCFVINARLCDGEGAAEEAEEEEEEAEEEEEEGEGDAGAAGQEQTPLLGPHAEWLRHLVPLDGIISDICLHDLMLSARDLAALATAMPGLQKLTMSHCGLAEGASPLELAPLPRLRELELHADEVGHDAASPAFQAALAELCCRCPSLERVTIDLYRDDDNDDDGRFDWQYAAEHLRATLALRGRAHVQVDFTTY